MSELEIIKQKIAENKEYLKETYGVEEIGVFGSVARNEASYLSDIDVLFDMTKEKKETTSLFDLVDMKVYLEKLLGKTVDIVEKTNIKPFYKKQILKELIMI